MSRSFSPNAVYHSPVAVYPGWMGHNTQSFPDSPSDSRVPRTPNVERQNIALDQSVPLTPIGFHTTNHESPGVATIRVPSTPEAAVSLSDSVSSPPLAAAPSPNLQSQALSNSSTPCRFDQLVPSTPKNLRKRNQRASRLSDPFLSPVPHCSSTPSYKGLFDSLSPVQWSPKADTSCNRTLFSPVSGHNQQDEESGYMSASSSRIDELDSASKSGFGDTSILFTSPCNSQADETQWKDSSIRPRKNPPPSRRRLSLCRQGSQDILRRTAHHNLAAWRSSSSTAPPITGAPTGTSSAFENILVSGNETITSTSFNDSGLVEVSMGEQTSSPKGSTKELIVPLMSPAGDADSLLLHKRANENEQDHVSKDTPQTPDNINTFPRAANSSSASGESLGASYERPKDILDLCD